MTKLSANFTSDEFKCPCCGKVKILGALVSKLQELRDIINKPIIITSGYRCPSYNKKIGGYVNSPHLLGEAADIQIKGLSTVTIAMIASKIKNIRIGLYPRHVHIDIHPANPSKYWLCHNYGDKPIYSKHEKNFAKFLKKNI